MNNRVISDENALRLSSLSSLNPAAENYATIVLDRLMASAAAVGASDIHIEQTAGAMIQLRWRVEGELVELGTIPDGKTAHLLSRIKAISRMVSYRHDIPQEGRMILATANGQLDARVSTLPLVHGERVVIRLAGRQAVQWMPEDLGLPQTTLERLFSVLEQTSGVVLITGPAGSGKTTTAYACVRHLTRQARTRSIVSLEDPVESDLPGVAQSQISINTGYCWSDGLKAVLRQDPEVLLVGEIRDDETARVVFQAAMTGQLVITTMHARSPADALRRLLDMQVPIHHVRSALDFLICQKLSLAMPSETDSLAGAGKIKRSLQGELLPPIEGELSQALLSNAGTRELEAIARKMGM
jgi:general secretion pathway protein E